MLRRLGRDLRSLLSDPAEDDAGVQRLFPRAYLDPTEEEAETQWRALAGSDLLRGRLDAVDALIRTTSTVHGSRIRLRLDAADEAAWLGVLNDLRLVLGSRLSLSDDPDTTIPADHPLAELVPLYDWLTSLQAALIDLLLAETPEEGRPTEL